MADKTNLRILETYNKWFFFQQSCGDIGLGWSMTFSQVVIHGPGLLPSCDFAFAKSLESSASS